jgi:hypothetical protein
MARLRASILSAFIGAVVVVHIAPALANEGDPLRATIAQIETHPSPSPALYRLAEDPAILVLDFPDLHVQAKMLNRIAAFIEKSDTPHDRVLTEAELDERIRAAGTNPDEYYEGHDYRGADLTRFFLRARQQNMPLNRQETWLAALVQQQGWSDPHIAGALISIPGTSAAIDQAARSAIFRHELSHGAYFTDPVYAALSRRLWGVMLTEAERRSFTGFLGGQEYNVANIDLMINETQAYLIHTGDKRFFEPEAAGLSGARAAALRAAFLPGIELPWLRQSALTVLPAQAMAGPPVASPAHARSSAASADRHGKGHSHHAAPAKACHAAAEPHCRKAG